MSKLKDKTNQQKPWTEIVQISRAQAEHLKGEVDFVCVVLVDLLKHLKIGHPDIRKQYCKRAENCCSEANSLLNQFHFLEILGEPLSRGEVIVRTFADHSDANEDIYADGLDPYQEPEEVEE